MNFSFDSIIAFLSDLFGKIVEFVKGIFNGGNGNGEFTTAPVIPETETEPEDD